MLIIRGEAADSSQYIKKEDKSKNKSIVKRHLHAPDNYVPRSLFNLSAVVRQREQERDKQTASVILFF